MVPARKENRNIGINPTDGFLEIFWMKDNSPILSTIHNPIQLWRQFDSSLNLKRYVKRNVTQEVRISYIPYHNNRIAFLFTLKKKNAARYNSGRHL